MHFMKEVKVQLMDVIIIGQKEDNGYKKLFVQVSNNKVQ